MESEFFGWCPRIEKLCNENHEILFSSANTIHLSFEPSCRLCQLSTSLIEIADPVSNVSECIVCGSPTQYVFCSGCINTIY